MGKLADTLITGRRSLRVKYEDIMLVLDSIDEIKREKGSRYAKLMTLDLDIGSCALFNEESSMWYMHFDLSDADWRKLIDKLACEDREIVLRKDNRFYLF